MNNETQHTAEKLTVRQRAIHMTINANTNGAYCVFDLNKWCSRYLFRNAQGNLTLKKS